MRRSRASRRSGDSWFLARRIVVHRVGWKALSGPPREVSAGMSANLPNTGPEVLGSSFGVRSGFGSRSPSFAHHSVSLGQYLLELRSASPLDLPVRAFFTTKTPRHEEEVHTTKTRRHQEER